MLRDKNRFITGLSFIIMAVAAGLAYGMLHPMFYITGNPEQTLENISSQRALFSVEILLWLVVAFLDIVVSVGLFKIYRKIHERLSQSMMVLRLVYTAVLLGSIGVLISASSAGLEALNRMELFETVWSLGLILFGVHLLLLGVLVKKSSFTPVYLFWLLLIGGVGYSLTNLLINLGPAVYELGKTIETILVIPMTLSEMCLAFWLIFVGIRGFRSERVSS